ncbi:MAG: diguanylate cyclase [Deltaproteobacteria bacterium]|nr:diguanylate cyclase [Deltaproteobacteria bacterium]
MTEDSKLLFDTRFFDSFFVSKFGALESARSARYGSAYSIILIHVVSFDNGENSPEKKRVEDFFRTVAPNIVDALRNYDVPGLLDDERLVVILPQTDYFGSLITVKKITRALEPFTSRGAPFASVLVTQATFLKDADSFEGLVKVARERMSAVQLSPWENMGLKNKLFWEVIAKVTEGGLDGLDFASFDVGQHANIHESFLKRINEVIINEIERTPKKRGILYFGTKNITDELPFKKSLTELKKRTETKIFIVGEGAQPDFDFKNATTIALSDDRLSVGSFMFFLSEDSAYAMITKEAWGGSLMCFHTSDPYVVEGLITKLQRDFHLQEQL